MNKLSTLKTTASLKEEVIFEKKSNHLSFKSFYNSQINTPSPYKVKSFKEKFKAFQRINQEIQRFFSNDKFASEKKEIHNVVLNLINHKNYEEINELLKNGFTLNHQLTHLLLSKFDKYDPDNQLLPVHKKEPLNGILAQILFCSSNFQIYSHSILEKLVLYFPQEKLSASLFDNFDDFNKEYKGIRIRKLGHDKDRVIEAMQIHNLCINPQFSMTLFCHVLLCFVMYYKDYFIQKNMNILAYSGE